MGARILWLNPSAPDPSDGPMADALRAEARPGTRVDVASLPGNAPAHLEYSAFEMACAPGTVGAVRWAEEQGYDGLVIGCFYDPALRAAREVSRRMPVTAPAEAALHLATTLGERVCVLVGREKWVPEMQENVVRYGFEGRVAGFRVLGLTVQELQADRAATEERIMREATLAVEGGADVVVLGCTMEFGFYRTVQAQVGVPVVDALVASLRYVELLADLAAEQGWSHSKRLGYQSPPLDELDAWVPPVEPIVVRDER